MASLTSSDGRYWRDDSFDHLANVSINGWSRLSNLPAGVAEEFAVPLDKCPEALKTYVRDNPDMYGDGRIEILTEDHPFFVFYIKKEKPLDLD